MQTVPVLIALAWQKVLSFAGSVITLFAGFVVQTIKTKLSSCVMPAFEPAVDNWALLSHASQVVTFTR